MRQKARSMDMPSLDYNNSDLETKRPNSHARRG